ncbi:IclR family transcriptional regulator [Haladaptatus sp. CMAA 1911]|uniref:IclR family transcriptional regulator n=1 Tax=unclassified Haladaptatus TaxID=2622732 RepID=UPI003754733F
MAGNGKTRTFDSDRKIIGILEAMREQELTGVTELSRELGIAKSTVHAHLNTLREYGFVQKKDKGYYLGLRFLDYGIHTRDQRLLFRAAKDKVDELAAETGERVWCVTEEGGYAVYLYGASGNSAIKTYETTGQHSPLHPIAAGKAILAFLPEERAHEIIDTTNLEQVTSDTITDRERLFAELETIRENGVAYNVEESLEGLHSVATPIRREGGGVYGAISIGGPANRLTKQYLDDELSDLLRGVGNEIEINIRHM